MVHVLLCFNCQTSKALFEKMIFCNAIFKQVAYGVGYVYAACINIYYHNNESSDFLLSVACVAF